MKLTVDINSDNAAFQDRYEAIVALRFVAEEILAGEDSGMIRDANGNTIGRFELTQSN